MQEIEISADHLIAGLLALSDEHYISILDSCGAGHLGSHLLIAGIDPIEIHKLFGDDPIETLRIFENNLSSDKAGIFTISYDLGLKLENIEAESIEGESDIYLALYDALIVHDYDSGKTFLTGNQAAFERLQKLFIYQSGSVLENKPNGAEYTSNFTKEGYIAAVETIREYIRRGDTYQANLTQQIQVPLAEGLTSAQIFKRLRRDHPAPFGAYLARLGSTVVSASPERFFKISISEGKRMISTSPIKGTRPRGLTPEQDNALRAELLLSEKDRAENTMIVDLLRNDIGRVCKFGTVEIEKLCDLEEHPTLFHLVSTVNGELREDAGLADILKALFPCGSITGAPKIRTMQIIEEIETADRGLSMGSIGCSIPDDEKWGPIAGMLDLSVAIRTMVIRDGEAVFNVGGGIVIDSEPEEEYEESLLKAKALLNAISG